VHEKPRADFTWAPEHPVEEMDGVLLMSNSKGQELNGWRWFMDQDANFRTTKDYALYTFPKSGNYAVVLLTSNTWGCSDTIIKTVKVESNFTFYMPNAFTPNEDGRNESFKPVMNGVRLFNFQVFDRWGKRLFVTEDQAEGWNGTYREERCKQGTYVWKVILTTMAGEQKIFTGSVLLFSGE
jgi:gliding motility-associated-like protein